MDHGMKRRITWFHGFVITTGSIITILTSIGGLAAEIGPPSILVWPITAIFGLILTFSYAELATMFPNKSGGISIYGAEAWKDKSPLLGAFIIWGYWMGWSPALAIFALTVGNYIHLLIPGVSAYISGAVILVMLFILNYFGIVESAVSQIILAIVSVIPLLIVSVVPLLKGQVLVHNLTPFLPLGHSWTSSIGITLVLGGMFVAAWTSYASEGAVAFGAEYKNPRKDLPRSVLSIAVVLLIMCTLLPFTFLGVLGQEQVSKDPSTAILPLAKEVFGNVAGTAWTIVLIFGLILSINGNILTSSRAIYQMSQDGYTFRFLGKLNRHGVPARAMAFDLIMNLLLMLIGTPLFILAASNVGYMLVLPLITGGALRLRKRLPNAERPFKVHKTTLWVSFIVALLGIVMLVGGVYTWGVKDIGLGLILLLLCFPIYYFRKYVEDPWEKRKKADEEFSVTP
jgi:amino acid transporter